MLCRGPGWLRKGFARRCVVAEKRPHDANKPTWSGVPNRAAVLFSDGGVVGSSHPGVGRPLVARLFLITLTTLNQTDQFVQQQAMSAYICGLWGGQSIDGRTVG
jgi:hypothetical protein